MEPHFKKSAIKHIYPQILTMKNGLYFSQLKTTANSGCCILFLSCCLLDFLSSICLWELLWRTSTNAEKVKKRKKKRWERLNGPRKWKRNGEVGRIQTTRHLVGIALLSLATACTLCSSAANCQATFLIGQICGLGSWLTYIACQIFRG